MIFGRLAVETYEARLADQKALYEAFIQQLREQIIRYEMIMDAQAQDIRDLTDKALQKHGSTAVQPPKNVADAEPTHFTLKPPIQAALEDDEERERAHYEQIEQQRAARRREALDVDDESREELLAAGAAAVEAAGAAT